MFDMHIHTAYSDGMHLVYILDNAAEAGLESIGLVDHAIVTTDPTLQQHKCNLAHVFDQTYELRRTSISHYQQQTGIQIYDGIECDFQMSDETVIRDFIESADFDYTIGSVHYVNGENIQFSEAFEGCSEAELDAVVDEYYTQLEGLIRSEIFDIVAHLDLIERNPRTAGRTAEAHIAQITSAFDESETVPEFNAGRIGTAPFDDFHPKGQLRESLINAGVGFTFGSDSHSQGDIQARIPELARLKNQYNFELIRPADICEGSV